MRVLIATDGSECSFEAARKFFRLVRDTHHEITVLSVVPLTPLGRAVEYLEIEGEREAMAALNRVRSMFGEAGISVETCVKQGVPSETIAATARDGAYDLIVIGRRGRGGFRESLLGRVGKRLLRNPPCSILVVR